MTTDTEISLVILSDILAERERQEAKWNQQNHPDEWYLPIMLEELGETAKAMLEAHFDYPGANVSRVRKELVETVAVGIAWLEAMERRDTSADSS